MGDPAAGCAAAAFTSASSYMPSSTKGVSDTEAVDEFIRVSLFRGLNLERLGTLGFPNMLGKKEADDVEDVDEEKEEDGDIAFSIPYL